MVSNAGPAYVYMLLLYVNICKSYDELVYIYIIYHSIHCYYIWWKRHRGDICVQVNWLYLHLALKWSCQTVNYGYILSLCFWLPCVLNRCIELLNCVSKFLLSQRYWPWHPAWYYVSGTRFSRVTYFMASSGTHCLVNLLKSMTVCLCLRKWRSLVTRNFPVKKLLPAQWREML